MTSIEVDTIKQHEKTTISTNKKDLLFYFYLLAMLTALFLRNAKGVNIPVAFLLVLTVIPVVFGTIDHIIATAVCCIPMSAGFQFKYALFICVAVYIIKQRGKIRLGPTFFSLLLMMIWELMHAFYGNFSIFEYFRSFAELIFLVAVVSMNFKKINYMLIFRAFSFATVGVCIIMFYLQLQQHDFDVNYLFGQGFGNFRFGQANTTAVNFGLNFNPNRLGFICNLSIAGILQLIDRKERSFFDFVLLLLSAIFGFMTLSRSYAITLLFIVLFYILTIKGSLKQRVKYVIYTLSSIVLILLVINKLTPNIFHNLLSRFIEDDLLGGRDKLFVFYNEHIFSSIDRFFFGIGLQDFQGKILAIHNVEINVPHNGIQEIWVAWGLIGTVLFIFMLLSLVKIAKKTPTQTR